MISIVIPTYNRSKNIQGTLAHLEGLKVHHIAYEVIFVDDGSADNTEEVLKKVCQQYSYVKGLVLSGNAGQQNATLAGLRVAKYPYIVTMDDDLSYNDKGIIALFDEIKKGYDVVYGVSSNREAKGYRRLGTWLKEVIFRLLLGKPYGLRLTSFRMMNRQVADYVSADQQSKVYLSARTLQFTQRIGNLTLEPLTQGDPSNYTLWKLIQLMGYTIKNYSKLANIFPTKPVKQYEIKEFYQ